MGRGKVEKQAVRCRGTPDGNETPYAYTDYIYIVDMIDNKIDKQDHIQVKMWH